MLGHCPLTSVILSEIHLSDLIRAHEGNTDFHDEDLNHIHWEKFNMMGRFIDGITQCQQSCRETKTYEKFPEDPRARDLLLIQRDHYLMDIEVPMMILLYPLVFLTPSF